MERTSHTHPHTTRGSKNMKNREKQFARNSGLTVKFSSAVLKFVKKVRTRKRRHFDRTEIPSI